MRIQQAKPARRPGRLRAIGALLAVALGPPLARAADKPLVALEQSVEVGRTPSRLVFAARSDNLYVTCAYDTAVVCIDAEGKQRFRQRLSPVSPLDLVCIQGDKQLIVTNFAADTIVWLDTEDGSIVGDLKLELKPQAIAASPDGKRIAVACDRAQSIHWIDPVRRERKGEPIVLNGPPGGLCFAPDGNTLYVTCGGPMTGFARVTPTGSMDHVELPLLAGTEVQVSRDGKQLYLCAERSLLLVEAKSGEVDETFELSSDPRHLLVIRRGRSIAVLLPKEKQLVLLDAHRGQIEQQVDVGDNPSGLALSSDGKRLAVAERSSGTVRIFQVLR